MELQCVSSVLYHITLNVKNAFLSNTSWKQQPWKHMLLTISSLNFKTSESGEIFNSSIGMIEGRWFNHRHLLQQVQVFPGDRYPIWNFTAFRFDNPTQIRGFVEKAMKNDRHPSPAKQKHLYSQLGLWLEHCLNLSLKSKCFVNNQHNC